MVRREGGRAYLLITFDLPNQKLISTEEVVGPFEGEFQEVIVDWDRINLIRARGDDTSRRSPWMGRGGEYEAPKGGKRMAGDGDPGHPQPPWTRTEIGDIEQPPEV